MYQMLKVRIHYKFSDSEKEPSTQYKQHGADRDFKIVRNQPIIMFLRTGEARD